MSYYNTVHQSGATLKEAVQKAASQEDAVHLIYRESGLALSPSQILTLCERAGFRYPLTSVRRAITDLTKSRKLVRTAEKITGRYGAQEFKWKAL